MWWSLVCIVFNHKRLFNLCICIFPWLWVIVWVYFCDFARFLPLLTISSIVEFIDCPICFSVTGQLFICCYFELDNCSFVVTFHCTIHEDKIVIYLNPRLKLVSTKHLKIGLVIFNHFCDSISTEWLTRLDHLLLLLFESFFLEAMRP